MTWCKVLGMVYAILKRNSRYRLNIGFLILFYSSIASKVQGTVGKDILEYQGKGSVSLNFYSNSKETGKIQKTVEVLTFYEVTCQRFWFSGVINIALL